MLLSLLRSARRLNTLLIVGSLVIGLARQGYCDVLVSPALINVTSTCSSATLTWSNSGTSSYLLLLMVNGSPLAIQNVTGTTFTFEGLTPGDYAVMIEAIAELP